MYIHSDSCIKNDCNIPLNVRGGLLGRVFTPSVVYTPPAPDYWQAPEPKEIKYHALAPQQHDVIFTQLVKAKIDTLMSAYPNIEWLVYLSGKREDNTTYINDLIVPVQSVTSVRVDKIELENMGSLPIVGVMHSHHGMGNGFSGTDDMFINANHLLSLCISHGGINGQFRWGTPEGDQVMIKASVKIEYSFGFDAEEFKKHCSENISEITYANHGRNFGYLTNTRNAYCNIMNPSLDDLMEELSDGDTDGIGFMHHGSTDIANIPNNFIIPPDNCPSCNSVDIVDSGDGWFCSVCGDEGYHFEEGSIGFNDVPVDEHRYFDNISERPKESVKSNTYPLKSEDFEEAESLGYIQCERCLSHFDKIDVYMGNHPTDHIDGDPECSLCKECFVILKYHPKASTVPFTWTTSKEVEVITDGVQCAKCDSIHIVDNIVSTPIGNICRGCYNLWLRR
jgi:hypothetical protein